MTGVAMGDISPGLQEAFLDVQRRRGLDQLTRAGGAPARIRQVLNQLAMEWRRLEREAGRRVSEDEVREWWVARYAAVMA